MDSKFKLNNFNLKSLKRIAMASAILNPVVMVFVAIKISRVISHKLNKCYSKLSLWMLI